MRKFFTVVLLVLFACPLVYSQKSSLKGSLADTTENKNVQNTVVSLMRAKDSVLVNFSRADRSGHFQLNNLDSGTFILMITHPYLGDYFDKLNVKANENTDLGRIVLIPKSKLLAEVILKSGSPIRIKGDTTVYTADSFKVRAGANVEELLRRLPGIQVDKDGNIMAMGEKVKKVLVDGEEFFGTDPGIATKNLRADVVKEVEVFDKKSDQAEFTGIDDGVKDKTINLKLKDDKKKGYFGKVELGGGLDDKYNNSVMMNAFKSKRKIAAYGIMSNTGQTNLDWQDAQNYSGGSDNMQMTDDGGIMIFNNDGDDNFWGGRNGIPRNWNGGLHYSNKYNNGKQSFNAGYKFSKVNAPGITRTFAQNFFPDSSWSTNSTNKRFASTNKHAFNLTVETTLDSNNTLKWTTRANNNTSRTKNDFFSEALSDAGQQINNNQRLSDNKVENNSVNSALLWKHKFKKVSRTLSVNTEFNWSQSKTDGLLFSRINYFDNGNLLRYDSLDQQNLIDNSGKSLSTKISYTEPLMKDTYLEISYGLAFNSNTSDRTTNAKDGAGKYENRIDSLSNAYRFNRLVNTPGLNFRVNKKKYTYSFGSSVGFSHFVQTDKTNDQQYGYNYVNFFPSASFNYKIKPSQNFSFNYNGSTTAPTLEQLQPIRVNTDPLNIYVGNPDLKQAFRHSFNVSFNSWNLLKEKNIWMGLNVNMQQNGFSQLSSIDSGVRTYQTVNANGLYNINLYSDYGFKIMDTKWRFGLGPTLNANRNVDYVRNGKTSPIVRNVTTSNGYGVRLRVNQYVENKYNFYIGPSFTLNESKASVNSASNIKYWQVQGWGSGNVTFLKKFELSSELNYQVRQKDPRFPANNNYMTWNAALVKRFFKGNDLEMKFSVSDILNQNRGYDRNFNSYSFTESYYNTLKRFWLLSLTWNISKNGKPASW